MKTFVSVALAILVAIGLWCAPWSWTNRGACGVRSDEGAYRTRLCELALWSGESALHDRMLEPRAGQDVPYGLFAPAASAFVLARTLPRAALDIENGVLDEDELANGAARLFLVIAWIGLLSLAFVGRQFVASAEKTAPTSIASGAGAWIAALAWTSLALAPSIDGGSVRAPVWGLILGALNLWGATKLARPRELIDQLGIAIGVGVITGIALLNDPFAWPALLAPLLALWLSVRGLEKRVRLDALRCGMFFIASALAVFGLRTRWPQGASPWPHFESAWQIHSGVIADPFILGACVLLGAWLLFTARASVERRALCAVLVTSLVLRAIDPRFAAAPLAPAGCAFVAWAISMWRAESDRALRRALSGAVALVLCLGAVFSDTAQYSKEAIEALRELRDSTPSSGAWNHPAAPQSYGIQANPRAAGVIAFHARRPVCGALLPGADVTDAARAAADALLSDSAEALACRASDLNAPYVIVTDRDEYRITDLWRCAGRPADQASGFAVHGSVLHQLLKADKIPGFELMLRVPAVLGRDPLFDENPALAEIAIWRLVSLIQSPLDASMRAR